MKLRIAAWAFAGLLIATCWAAYLYPAGARPMNPAAWTIARLSCPLSLAGEHFHVGVTLYAILISNAILYALVGLAFEALFSVNLHSKPATR